MKAETGAMISQAKECQDGQKTSSNEERPGTDSFSTTLRRNQPCRHFGLRLLASRAETINFCCSSCSVCGTLLWQPFQTNKPRKSKVLSFVSFFTSCTIQVAFHPILPCCWSVSKRSHVALLHTNQQTSSYGIAVCVKEQTHLPLFLALSTVPGTQGM